MAASLSAARGTGSLLEPGNEGLDGEGLGELSTAGGSRGGAGSRSSLSGDGGSSRGGRSGGRGSGRSSGGSGGSAVASTGCGSRGRAGAGAGAASPQSRAGDVVVDGRGVGVEDDAVLLDGVQLGTDDTLGLVRSGASNLDVETLD